MNLRLDCRFFRGDKPCRYACACDGCAHYAPMGARILIIKLDAVGDVARTTTLLRPLRRAFDPCHITWLVHPNGEQMLRGNPEIDRLLAYRPEGLEPLRVETFDRVLCLDKTPAATAVAMQVAAPVKLGFGLSRFGTVHPLNPGAEYAFALGLDDDLKFRRNKRTYQDVLFEIAGLPWEREEYCIAIGDDDRAEAAAALKRLGIRATDRVIGLNLGGGKAFANKMWSAPEAVRFIRILRRTTPCKVLLFGADLERDKIASVLKARLPGVKSALTPHSCRVFQALLARCDIVVTSDSLGMHLAIAERRPVVALFGPTCAQEIELYGRGEAISSPVDCAPCYRADCRKTATCLSAIAPERVVEAVRRWLPCPKSKR